MAREPQNARTDSEETPDVPDDAAHVVVVGLGIRAGAPDGHDADLLTYEAGDELPFDLGTRTFPKHPSTLAILDEEGYVVAGAKPMDSERSTPVQDALEIWRRGDGFDPSEYENDG